MSNSSFDVESTFRLRSRVWKIMAAAKRTVVAQNSTTGEYDTFSRAALATAYRHGDLVFQDLFAPDATPVADEALAKSMANFGERERRDVQVKLHYLRDICPTGVVRVKRSELRDRLRACHAALPAQWKDEDGKPPSVSIFYQWRHTWIGSGFQAASLVNRFDLRGRRPEEVSPALQPFLEQAINEKYATSNRPTVAETVDHAGGLVERHNLLVSPYEALPRPTRRQVLREIRRSDRYQVLERRYGKAHARRATNLFGRKEEPARLLDRVEVDHTPIDVLALTSEGGLVARPYLTVLIDVASRMVLGIWISLRTPNSGVVLRALRDAALPKDDLLRKYRIKGEYPVHGVPRELVMDNGRDFLSEALETAALDLQIKLVYCPRRQPRFKGVIERFLKEINYQFAHLLPGTTFDRYFKRGDVDSLKDAVIPLEDLKRLVWQWIVTIYSRSFHRGIGTCPIEKWKELLKHGKPPLPRRIETLKIYTSPVEMRTLTDKGIEINGQHYICDELRDLRQRPGKWELSVRPDLDDLGQISVLHPEKETHFQAQSTMPDYARGLSVEQHEWIKRLGREKYKALPYERQLLLAKLDLHDEVQAMAKARDDAAAAALKPSAAKGAGSKPRRPKSEKHAQAVAERSEGLRQVEPAAPVTGEDHPTDAMPIIDFGSLKSFETGQQALF